MVFKALLTSLEAIPEKGEIVLSFRDTHSKSKKEQINLGNLYIPEQKHLFFTDTLGVNYGPSLQFKNLSNYEKFKGQLNNLAKNQESYSKYLEIIRRLKENLKKIGLSLADFMKGSRFKDKYWWIYQIYLPMKLKDYVPDDFIREDYTQWARRRLACPGKFVNLDDALVEAFKKKNKIKNELIDFRKQIDKLSKKSYATRRD